MSETPPPLVLCMEDINGKEVELKIEKNDSFQIFLDKSKDLLGYDIDMSSLTGNQPVSLTDNAYTFLLNAEQNLPDSTLNPTNFDLDTDQNGTDDLEYILDDGTQIRASQIQFDNEDPLTDLTLEKIPFVKYADGVDELEENTEVGDVKDVNITSPVSNKNSPRCNFANSLPFKLVCSNASNFEAQFTKYLEERCQMNTTMHSGNKNKSPRSLINDNYKPYENINRNDFFTREDILNMFKNSPVTPLPYDGQSSETRKHVRKTDPSRLGSKNWNAKPLIDIDAKDKHVCSICGQIVDSKKKLYIFDKEDQMLHRCEQKKSTQLKVICEMCLTENFVASRFKSPDESLNSDEYLVIKNNQQYIFQKTTPIVFKNSYKPKINDEIKETSEFVKVEIGPDGEIVTNPIDTDVKSDDVIIIGDEKKDNSSDVEILEPEIDIENIDEDENIKEFLGKYQCDIKELICRYVRERDHSSITFCSKDFKSITEVIEHGEEHKHDLEDENVVFPCPLCDYGYANFKFLKAHLKVAHEAVKKDQNAIEQTSEKPISPESSPVAKRTRSSIKKSDLENDNGTKENQIDAQCTENVANEMTFITEVKQECLDSDDSIWIVQTGDNDEELHSLLKVKEENTTVTDLKKHKCFKCSKIFPNSESLSVHKCRKRGRKRKSMSKDESVIFVPSQEDFIKRAQGRPRPVERSGDNDLLVERTRKKKTRESNESQIVTCHNCNESFTSKVRLKFHMQFHDTTNLLTSDGQYKCLECEDTKFPTETELFDHVHFQHDKQKRWQCPVKGCGKTFFLRATLTKHSRTHTDTRRYVCVTCGKRFLDKQTLDEHGVTHLQIKPFQCHICLKQLTRRSRLRMHLRAHEEELSPALVLVCAICFRAFRDHNDAQEHATKSTECIAEFTKDLKEETEASEQLSPTSGIVRHSVRVVEYPRLTHGIERQVNNEMSEALLSNLDNVARNIIRVVNVEKAFRCEYCEDVFYLEDALNNHRIIHKGIKNPFTCHICKVSFATYSRCTTHKTTHGFYKRSATESRNEGTSGPASAGILGYGGFPVVKHFLCEDCGRSYLHWTYLQVHRRTKHANENYVFKCNQCELTFPNSWSVTYHRKKTHNKNGQEENGGFTKIVRENFRIPCRDCDAILPNKTELYRHRKNEHSDESMQVVRQGDGQTTICNLCGHNLHNPYALQKHIKEVHGCSDKKLSSTCPVCSRTFRSASVLDEHVRVHTGERPFPCDVCGVAFRRLTAMKNHRLIHNGIRPWACTRCPKRFRIKSDLRTHIRLKHPAHLAVIEIEGIHCSTEDVHRHLAANNIPHDKIIEVTMISFMKDTINIVPNSMRALSLLSEVPKTQIIGQKPTSEQNDVFQPCRRVRGIAKTQSDVINNENVNYEFNNSESYHNNLSDINVQLLLQDGGLVNANQMVELDIKNDMLQE